MAFFYDAHWYIVREGGEILISRPGAGETVRLPLDVFDDICMMRSAQLSEENEQHPGMLHDVMERACAHGTLGAEALRRWMQIPSVMVDYEAAAEELGRDVPDT